MKAAYISHNAPELKGFSDKNLWRMKQFYELYSADEKLSPLVREISWTHNMLIMSCLEALDRDVKKPHENPSIGILLCADKDNDVVEYAMSRSMSPTLVARYELALPDKKTLQQKMREIYLSQEGGN